MLKGSLFDSLYLTHKKLNVYFLARKRPERQWQLKLVNTESGKNLQKSGIFT